MHSKYFAPLAGSARTPARAFYGSQLLQSHAPRVWPRFPAGRGWCINLLAAALCVSGLVLSGCGALSGGLNAALAGSLVPSTNTLSFGSVPVGQTMSSTVSLKNASADPVQISQINISGASFTIATLPSLPITIAGGASYPVNVKFAPAAVGTTAGDLTLVSNSSTGNPTVALSGTGAAAAGQAGTAATMISPTPGSALPGSSATFIWTAGSGVTAYQLWLGTTGAGSQNLGAYSEGPASGSTVSTNVTDLPTNGATTYVRLLSQIQGNWQSADYTYTEATMGSANEATLSAVSCSSATITGTGTDSCAVTLSAPAGEGGLTVNLASSDSALTVPATITVAANANSASFTAMATSVTAAQSATITATLSASTASYALQLDPEQTSGGTPALRLSAETLAFGDVTVGAPATPQVLTLTSSGSAALDLTGATVTGAGFSISGVGFPVSLNPGQAIQLQVKFDPTATGAATGTLTIASNAAVNGTVTVGLSGTGDATPGVLSGLSCNSSTITGAGSDNCTLSLSAAAPAGGLTVNLSSSDTSLSVPASVTIPSGSSSGSFMVTAGAVTTEQTASINATSGGITKVYALELKAVAPGLSVSTNQLAFGDVNLNTTSTETVTLTSSGTSALVINTATLTGTGFTMTAATLPLTLNPGQSTTLQVKFDPTTAGAATGSITVVSNAATNGTATINLSGTGDSTAGVLSALSCTNAEMSGDGTDACEVRLSAAAPAGGLAVALTSSSSAVSVPATVTVSSGATTAAFSAAVSAVTSSETATLTATSSGISKVYALQLTAQTVGLSLSANSLAFGDVNLDTPTSQTLTLTSSGTAALTINAATLTGSSFKMTGATFPMTLNPGKTATLQVTFDPASAGAVTGSILITSDASANPTATISLSGTGDSTAGALSELSCANASMSGAGEDACTVTLNAAAPTGGLVVTLASTNTFVAVPATLTVPAGSTSAGFSASVAAVPSAQTASLTATAGGVTKTFALQLAVSAPGLTIGSTTVNFGTVDLNAPATQTLTLTSSGTAPLTLSAGTLTGTGFTMSGVTFPVTLNPGQSATLDLQFDPTVVGTATGLVTITSNDPTAGTATIALTGTGATVTLYQVQLSWDAPASSTDPVAGYHIYRASGSGSYLLLNSAVNATTTYSDTTVQGGTTYTYEVTSVDASGVESVPSNVYTAVIP